MPEEQTKPCLERPGPRKRHTLSPTDKSKYLVRAHAQAKPQYPRMFSESRSELELPSKQDSTRSAFSFNS